MTESTPESNPEPNAAAAAAIARSRAKRAASTEPAAPRRSAPAKGGKFLAAGAAVGLSLAAVGAMSAATQNDSATQPPPVQRVVISQPAQTPQQIVIVMPGADAATPSTTVVDLPTPAIVETVEVTKPVKPSPPPAPAVEKAPVTESGGS